MAAKVLRSYDPVTGMFTDDFNVGVSKPNEITFRASPFLPLVPGCLVVRTVDGAPSYVGRLTTKSYPKCVCFHVSLGCTVNELGEPSDDLRDVTKVDSGFGPANGAFYYRQSDGLIIAYVRIVEVHAQLVAPATLYIAHEPRRATLREAQALPPAISP